VRGNDRHKAALAQLSQGPTPPRIDIDLVRAGSDKEIVGGDHCNS
jgi:hypothetical protein